MSLSLFLSPSHTHTGTGQTNLRMPQGCYGQVSSSEQSYMVRWDYSYSSWTLFTCEIEMLLHVVSTAGKYTPSVHTQNIDHTHCATQQGYYSTHFNMKPFWINDACCYLT